jgi:lipoprotein NlpI
VVAETAFVRNAPLPGWAQPLALPPPQARDMQPPVLVRLADTQLWAGDTPAYLVNRAEQVNDAAALGQIGQVALHFNPHYQRLLLHRVAIVRDGQVMEHTSDVPVRFLQREAGLEQGVVSGVTTASMVLPDVRRGDTLHLVYTVEGENPIFAGRYAGWAGWDQSHPVVLRHVSLTTPLQRPIRWQWLGDRPGERPQPVESVHGTHRRLSFEGRQLPGVPFEPCLPRDAHPLRWLQFSEFASWAEVAAWARKLFPADAALPQALGPVMQRLRTQPTREEQVSQALQWVQAEIRYYSVSLGESSHKPHSPAEVVAQRYGDCKDKSFLLARMLQTLGIDAHPALVAAQTRQAPLKLLPSPEAFDHVIVQVRLNGRDFYLDPTRLGQSGPLEHMGQGMEDAAVLVVAPGVTHLARVHSPNRAQLFANELHERYAVPEFGAPALLESEQHWFGLGAESLRAMLSRMDADQLAHWALGRYDRRHPGITLDGTPRVVHDAQLNRLSVIARYQVPRPAHECGGEWSLRFFATNLQGAFVIPETLTRQLPLAMPSFPGRMQYVVEVQWPESVSQVAPAHTERLDTAHFSLQVTRSLRGPMARETVMLQPLVAAVPAAELPQLMEDMRRIDELVQGRFTVQAADAGHRADTVAASLQQRLASQLRAQAQRSGRAIERGHLHGDDLAQAHCLRAEALSELGDGDAALHDAQAAVRLAPALARAWACRGKAHWALGRFDEADADFSRALQLDGEPCASYLHRGQARFYQGRFERAADDFGRAASQAAEQAQRLHALVWQGWALKRLGRHLPASLQAAATEGAHAAWPRPALALLAGTLSAEQLLAEAASAQGDARTLALVEAWFTLGQHHLAHGQSHQARDAFEKTREAGVMRYAEHAAAGFELQRLGAPR